MFWNTGIEVIMKCICVFEVHFMLLELSVWTLFTRLNSVE